MGDGRPIGHVAANRVGGECMVEGGKKKIMGYGNMGSDGAMGFGWGVVWQQEVTQLDG